MCLNNSLSRQKKTHWSTYWFSPVLSVFSLLSLYLHLDHPLADLLPASWVQLSKSLFHLQTLHANFHSTCQVWLCWREKGRPSSRQQCGLQTFLFSLNSIPKIYQSAKATVPLCRETKAFNLTDWLWPGDNIKFSCLVLNLLSICRRKRIKAAEKKIHLSGIS